MLGPFPAGRAVTRVCRVTYRVLEGERCSSCGGPLAGSEGTYGPDGSLLCRRCQAALASEEASRTIAAFGSPPREGPFEERRSPWARWLLAPGGLIVAIDLLYLLDARSSGASCSELGCIELFLIPVFGLPLALLFGSVAIALSPSRLRARTAVWVLASMVALVAAFVAPLAGALR